MNISIYPVLDDRCRLFSGILWTKDHKKNPTLMRQHVWAGFSGKIKLKGAIVSSAGEETVKLLRFETSPDKGKSWHILKEFNVDEKNADKDGVIKVSWKPFKADNIRVVVEEPGMNRMPLSSKSCFSGIEIELEDNDNIFSTLKSEFKFVPLEESAVCIEQPFAGKFSTNIQDRPGSCHLPMETDRVFIRSNDGDIIFKTPLMNMIFSSRFALLRSIGWDMANQNREELNLLSSGNTQGAFPVAACGMERFTSDRGGGKLLSSGRRIEYRDVSILPGFKQTFIFHIREDGFSLEVKWNNKKTFRTHEFAALRLPFDLYQTVTSILALPETTGPSGLVKMPMIIHAPNHGSMRITVQEKTSHFPVYGRVSPFRVTAELWLDIIAGAKPLECGLFEVPAGKGSVTLDFSLTKIFPLANTDIFNRWQRPPSYSFVDRENILGALPNSWLSGLGFRPEMGMFANNSVAEAAMPCAWMYAETAAYTPELAPGLAATDLLRFATDSYLSEYGPYGYADYQWLPWAASSPLECAWLTVASTGDWDWAEKHREAIAYRARVLLSLELEKTGMIISRKQKGIPGQQGTAAWFDSIRTGHLEALSVAHGYRSAIRASELLERLNEKKLSLELKNMAKRARKNFMKFFFNATEKRIAMWVDAEGNRHCFDSHAHLAAPIECGLVPTATARQLLREYLERLNKKSPSREYGLPVMLEPIPADCHNNWKGKGVEKDGSDATGVYQNGSNAHFNCYYILQALYKNGMRHEANDLFMKITPLAVKGGMSGGLHSGLDWRHKDGRPSGYEGLLAEQFHFLLAAITGYLGLELTLDGVKTDKKVLRNCSERVRILKPDFGYII